MTCVRAPGSSANLGPGFDVLGIALSRHVWIGDDGIGRPCPADDPAAVAHRLAGGRGPIWIDTNLPPGRGLGFSAAMRAAAAVLAGVQDGLAVEPARDRAYPLVAELEGHADNAAPAVYGGLQLVADDQPLRLDVHPPGTILLWVPDIETSTDGSRRILPDQVDRADAVFNLGRVALLVAALHRGDPELLRRGTEDRLHQPQRLAACAPARAAMEAALDHGAAGAWLSGSGPSVAMIVA
ncbi:MAG: homoserine kinase, partial [Actinomycetota bacterium]